MLKIPIKHERCLIYNSIYRDYKEEIYLVMNEMLSNCNSDYIIENYPTVKGRELNKGIAISGAL